MLQTILMRAAVLRTMLMRAAVLQSMLRAAVLQSMPTRGARGPYTDLSKSRSFVLSGLGCAASGTTLAVPMDIMSVWWMLYFASLMYRQYGTRSNCTLQNGSLYSSWSSFATCSCF